MPILVKKFFSHYEKYPDISAVLNRFFSCFCIGSGGGFLFSTQRILNNVISVASSEHQPKAVELEQDDFIPWKRGVSL